MPLPLQDVERELTHTRRVRFEGYKRADGLWDIEAHLSDIKNHDFHLQTGVRRAGQPIHEMWLRLTIDRNLTILDAAASMDALPYPGVHGSSRIQDREIAVDGEAQPHLVDRLTRAPHAGLQVEIVVLDVA